LGQDWIEARVLLVVQSVEAFRHPFIPASRQEFDQGTREQGAAAQMALMRKILSRAKDVIWY